MSEVIAAIEEMILEEVEFHGAVSRGDLVSIILSDSSQSCLSSVSSVERIKFLGTTISQMMIDCKIRELDSWEGIYARSDVLHRLSRI